MSAISLLPNALTLSRVILCPLIVHLFLIERYSLALSFYALAGLTDYFDGLIARKYNVRTEAGTVLDPLCDKIYSLTFFTLGMKFGLTPQWFVVFIVAIAVLQAIGFLSLKWLASTKSSIIPASRLGKWNTTIQFIWMGILLLAISIQWSSPALFSMILNARNTIFGALACLQTTVFLRYYLAFRYFLLPETRQI